MALLLFQVTRVSLFRERYCFSIPVGPLPGFVAGDEQDRVASWIEEEQDSYLRGACGAGAEFFQVVYS